MYACEFIYLFMDSFISLPIFSLSHILFLHYVRRRETVCPGIRDEKDSKRLDIQTVPQAIRSYYRGNELRGRFNTFFCVCLSLFYRHTNTPLSLYNTPSTIAHYLSHMLNHFLKQANDHYFSLPLAFTPPLSQHNDRCSAPSHLSINLSSQVVESLNTSI